MQDANQLQQIMQYDILNIARNQITVIFYLL